AEAPAAKPSGAPAVKKAEALAKTADIPVGGGTVFKDAKIVVTQPKAGEFKAFTSVCTHQGCDVGSVADGAIVCPCHGSKFAIADGSVTAGPASRPLEKKEIKVDGDSIVLS
ncbi:Rieske (2Fe-2S) protein, partial [Streptosporangium algeriense]